MFRTPVYCEKSQYKRAAVPPTKIKAERMKVSEMPKARVMRRCLEGLGGVDMGLETICARGWGRGLHIALETVANAIHGFDHSLA